MNLMAPTDQPLKAVRACNLLKTNALAVSQFERIA